MRKNFVQILFLFKKLQISSLVVTKILTFSSRDFFSSNLKWQLHEWWYIDNGLFLRIFCHFSIEKFSDFEPWNSTMIMGRIIAKNVFKNRSLERFLKIFLLKLLFKTCLKIDLKISSKQFFKFDGMKFCSGQLLSVLQDTIIF